MNTMKIFSIRIDSIQVDTQKPFAYLEFEPAEVLKTVQTLLNADNLEMIESSVQFALWENALFAYGSAYAIDADTPKVQIIG